LHTQDDKIWVPDILPPVVFKLPRLHSVAISIDLQYHMIYGGEDRLPKMPLLFLEELDLQVPVTSANS
jgi:hypothetical protein